MSTYRPHLPQLDGGLFLTDAGLETDLIFNRGVDIPAFAAHTLLSGEKGREALRRYFSLDACTTLHAGDPQELARQYRKLVERLPWIDVLGGCCGSDFRHVAAIADELLADGTDET